MGNGHFGGLEIGESVSPRVDSGESDVPPAGECSVNMRIQTMKLGKKCSSTLLWCCLPSLSIFLFLLIPF